MAKKENEENRIYERGGEGAPKYSELSREARKNPSNIKIALGRAELKWEDVPGKLRQNLEFIESVIKEYPQVIIQIYPQQITTETEANYLYNINPKIIEIPGIFSHQCIEFLENEYGITIDSVAAPTAETVEERVAEPITEPAEKPAKKPAKKVAEKPAKKPAKKVAEKPAKKPAEKPVAEPAPAEKPAKKPAKKVAVYGSSSAVLNSFMKDSRKKLTLGEKLGILKSKVVQKLMSKKKIKKIETAIPKATKESVDPYSARVKQVMAYLHFIDLKSPDSPYSSYGEIYQEICTIYGEDYAKNALLRVWYEDKKSLKNSLKEQELLQQEHLDELFAGLLAEKAKTEPVKPEPVKPEETTEEPAEEPVEEPAEEPAEETVEEPAEEPAEEPVEEPAEETAEETVEEPAEETTEETVEEPAEEPVEEPAEETTEETVEETPSTELVDLRGILDGNKIEELAEMAAEAKVKKMDDLVQNLDEEDDQEGQKE